MPPLVSSDNKPSSTVNTRMGILSKIKNQQKKAPVNLSDEVELNRMCGALGAGPMRFCPLEPERPIEEQLASLGPDQRACVDVLRQKWHDKHPEENLSDEVLLRFARNSAGDPFTEKTAWRVLKRFETRYLSLRASDPSMEKQLSTRTLYPLPGLKTKDNKHDVFYMRPSRYSPKTTAPRVIIDNLVYVMNSMLEREQASTEGIAFLADMTDWNMKNYNTDYCFQFMQTVQGARTPVQVRLFLIVAPPSWFSAVWSMMKPMLAESFRSRVKMISEDQLGDYLQSGYERYLPSDMATGKVSSDKLVRDFITFRIYREEGILESKNKTSTATLSKATKKVGRKRWGALFRQ